LRTFLVESTLVGIAYNGTGSSRWTFTLRGKSRSKQRKRSENEKLRYALHRSGTEAKRKVGSKHISSQQRNCGEGGGLGLPNPRSPGVGVGFWLGWVFLVLW